MGVEHHASLPGEPKTNSLIERTNQFIVGGTTALLICAGLPPCYWSFAAPCFCVSYNIQGVTDQTPWAMYHGLEFPGVIIPFGCLVYYKPPNTNSNDSGKWDPDARKGIFAGYSMRSVYEWGKAYLVWDLESFRSSDLRTCASHEHQRIGIPLVSGRCELPADGNITFPLKSHYGTINVDIFNPFLIESDPQDGEEEDQDAIRARAPQDLDACIPLLDDPVEPPVAHLSGGAETPIINPLGGEAPHWEDRSPREAVFPGEDFEDPSPINEDTWISALKTWCKHVSCEVPKQVVVTLMTAPDVEGYTTRGVTVTSVPIGAEARLINSRHHVPSQAEWRRTAVLLREEDIWYWAGPLEHWAVLPDPTPLFTIEGFTVRYTVTLFYDRNREDGEPSYMHKSKKPDVACFWDITMADDGRLCKKDLGGRWRTVDESGTGVRAGSTRPPDIQVMHMNS